MPQIIIELSEYENLLKLKELTKGESLYLLGHHDYRRGFGQIHGTILMIRGTDDVLKPVIDLKKIINDMDIVISQSSGRIRELQEEIFILKKKNKKWYQRIF